VKIRNSHVLKFSVIDIYIFFFFGLCFCVSEWLCFVFLFDDFCLILWNRILDCFSFYKSICYFAIASLFFELQVFVGFRIFRFDCLCVLA